MGLGGAVVALRAVDLPFLEEVLRAHLSFQALSPGEVGQEKGYGTTCRFLNACCPQSI
jgi:hypothetical protein